MKAILPRTFLLTLVAAAAVLAFAHAQDRDRQRNGDPEPVTLTVAARIEHEPIVELSGIVKSRSRDNLYWVHNDSGDGARLFAIDGEGKSIIPTYSRFSFHGETPEEGKSPWQGFTVLNAQNVDWEDIATDGRYLYVADTGNNLNMRRDLAIYMLSEIDPSASTQTAAIRRMPVRYPEQKTFPALEWHYDSESLFVDGGSLYLITKHRRTGTDSMEAGANLYRLDTRYTDQENLLRLVDSHPDILAATAAELSPAGNTLAVLSRNAIWLFDRPAKGDQWLSSTYKRIGLRRRNIGQAEALTWEDGDTLLIGNEQRDLFRLDLPAE